MVLAPHPNPESPVLSHFDLSGKTALVTGGSRGIGLEVVRGLVEAGAKVAFTYSSTPSAEADKLAADISAASNDRAVRAYKVNVRSRTEIEAIVEKTAAELGEGRLDIVVANAGIATHIPAIEYPEDKFREMFDVNVNGAFWTAQAAAKVFERQWKKGGENTPHRGSIIFTASVSATLVNVPQKQAAYNASKAALVHLSKSLAVEWVDFARVNSVSPGFIDTDMLSVHPEEWRKQWFSMIPGRRLCKAAELKGTYVYLASDASSYMTGADLIIDGGYTLP
ncbi:uncharacterized protein JN550_003147 [Neoarthrinium moseri]|uniref:uncharacterized protein n=1 Tax=Neoarthrinium moseri TaxID=1658444 RepID=UPI001FDB6827|nr:uncharacterized protein JN550_003147 [Neoarthrinium moseri]KAI1873878.1 hypothetical protein JN550_003147 [Neoarthrinium moseri]